jgi:hypothetical protein
VLMLDFVDREQALGSRTNLPCRSQ